ncbi:hypothetical protein KY289_019843 [Solanum tuberosum]|nr:hypothetical protein KY289_019843 [Solanum tuberosum]
MMLYIVGLFGIKNWCSGFGIRIVWNQGLVFWFWNQIVGFVWNQELVFWFWNQIPFHMYTWLELKAAGSIEPCAKG